MEIQRNNTTELLEGCRSGDYVIGLDLGHGKSFILNSIPDNWKERWGERQPTFWKPILTLLLMHPILYLASILLAFLFWRWYWAILITPVAVAALMIPLVRGFRHPRPFMVLPQQPPF